MRRFLGLFALVVAAIVVMLLAATDVAAAQSTTTAPPPSSTQPMLPTTTNSDSMPQTGQDSVQLVGIAVSCLLIGYGMCSIGRGVRTETVP
jgi:hypothetical protein